MNRKISLGLALTLIIASVTATFAITMSVSQNIYNGLISNLSERVEMYSSISDLYSLISTNYYYYNSINFDNTNISISRGCIDGLGDSTSRFLTAAEYLEYNRKTAGTATGVGITTTWDKENGNLVITSVADGSSAATKGVKVGDIITKIGSDKVTKKNYTELLKTLEGDSLTTVDLVCSRDGEIKEFKVTIGYSYVSVTSKNLDGIGYIRITAFYGNTKQQLRQAVNALSEEGVNGIVFDLRNTFDGSIENAAAAVDCITPICSDKNDVLVSLIGRDGDVTYSYSSTSNDLNLPMVVLINGSTSGPAELFACDLRDFNKASLVGETSKGVGTAQDVFTLEDGNAVILTTAIIKPYKSESFEKKGLAPDYEVALSEENAERVDLLEYADDLQLQKAVSVLFG